MNDVGSGQVMMTIEDNSSVDGSQSPKRNQNPPKPENDLLIEKIGGWHLYKSKKYPKAAV